MPPVLHGERPAGGRGGGAEAVGPGSAIPGRGFGARQVLPPVGSRPGERGVGSACPRSGLGRAGGKLPAFPEVAGSARPLSAPGPQTRVYTPRPRGDLAPAEPPATSRDTKSPGIALTRLVSPTPHCSHTGGHDRPPEGPAEQTPALSKVPEWDRWAEAGREGTRGQTGGRMGNPGWEQTGQRKREQTRGLTFTARPRLPEGAAETRICRNSKR